MLQLKRIEVPFSGNKVTVIASAIFLFLLVLPILLPSAVYQGLIESRLEKSTGLNFEFRGPFSFSLLPSIAIEAQDVQFSGRMASGMETLGEIPVVTLDMSLWQFVTGDLHVTNLQIETPNVTLSGDFTPQIPDWIRNRLSAARKQDIRYFEVLRHFVKDSVFDMAQLIDAKITWKKSTNETIVAHRLNIAIEKPREGKDFTVKGDLFINDRSVDISMRLQRPDDFIRGFRSKLNLKLDSTPLRLEFNGNGAHRQSFVAQGDLQLEIPSTFEFCSWFKSASLCEDKASRISMHSSLKLRDQRLKIDDAVFIGSDLQLKGNGSVDFKSLTPKILANILIPPKSLKDLYQPFNTLGHLDLESLFLDSYDANIDVKFQGLTAPGSDVIAPHIKFLVEKGHLTVASNKVNIFGGIGNFRLRWHKGAQEGLMDLRFDANSIDVAKLQNGLEMDYQVTGTLNTAVELLSKGSLLNRLLRTSRVHGEFNLLDGNFLNPAVSESLNAQTLNHFAFAEIKGRLKGEKGRLSSNDISFVAPSVKVEGAGYIDFIEKVLEIQLNSHDNEQQSTDEKGFVRISGRFSNPILTTSASGNITKAPKQGLHSGLIPNTQENANLSIDDQIQFEETDLLD